MRKGVLWLYRDEMSERNADPLVVTMEEAADERLRETPKGAFAVVILFGLCLFIIWSWVYFGIFAPRG